MDTDWCLYCNRHVDGSDLYCSEECKNWAGPSSSVHPYNMFSISSSTDDEDVVYHAHLGAASIRAWASKVPQGPPVPDSTEEETSSLSALSVRSLNRPPILLRMEQPVSPSVCMSTPIPTNSPPSKPISTPHKCTSALQLQTVENRDAFSSWSSVTDSTVATPNTAPASSILSARDARCQARFLQKNYPHGFTFQPPCIQTPYTPDMLPFHCYIPLTLERG